MDSFKNNFDSFDDEQTDLPEGFGWEDMSAGIYEKMPEQKRRRFAGWWWFGAGFLTLGIGLFLLVSQLVSTQNDPAQTISSQQENATTQSTVSASTQEENVPQVLAKAETPEVTQPNAEISDTKTTQVLAQAENVTENQTSSATSATRTMQVLAKAENVTATQLTTEKAATTSTEVLAQADKKQGINPTIDAEEARNAEVLKSSSIGLSPKPALPTIERTDEVEIAIKEGQQFANETAINGGANEEASAILLAETAITKELNLLELSVLSLFEREGLIAQRVPSIRPEPELSTEFTRVSSLELRGLVVAPMAFNSASNSNTLRRWYGFGGQVTYQHQLHDRFGLSATYSYQQVKEEFSFYKVDTIDGSDYVDQAFDYYNRSTSSLIGSSTKSYIQQVTRERNILKYNRLDLHSLTLEAHYLQPIGKRNTLDFGLGAGVQVLGKASGIRLQENGELADLRQTLSGAKVHGGQLSARLTFLHELSPKFDFTAGVQVSHALSSRLPGTLGAGLPSTIGAGIGLRYRISGR